jgi:hypothetical protein
MNEKRAGYYGRPIVKPPEWTALIPIYFWAGGWAGTSATLALGARLAKNERAARALLVGAASGSAISGFCLIADLKKPQRFLNMLRVFKPSSPMSVGVYLFSIFAGAAMTAAASDLTGIARPLGRAAEIVAGMTGPFMSVYTAVLIGDTVIPAWHYARLAMPVLFAATSTSTAGGLGMCLVAHCDAKAARRLALIGGASVPMALERVRRELGPIQFEAYERGKAGFFAHLARLLNIGGTMCTLLAGRKARAAKVAGAMLLAGGLAERFAVYHAGRISAQDPKFTIEAQGGFSA